MALITDPYGATSRADDVDPWGRTPDDPWYNIPPNINQPIPYAPGQGPGSTGTGPTPAAPAGPVPPTTPPPTTPPDFRPGSYSGAWAPDTSWWVDAPRFDFQFQPFTQTFTAPTMEEAQNEPGYAFARDEGLRAITNSAAARGLVRSGGNLKALASWNNALASQNYGSVYDRRFGEFKTLLDIYRDNENRRFDIAKAQYEPTFKSWSGRMDVLGGAAKAAFDRSYDVFKQAEDERLRWNEALLNAGRD